MAPERTNRLGGLAEPVDGVVNHGATALDGDRRAVRRHRVSVWMKYAAAGERRRANVYNLGTEGVFIRTTEPLATGEKMDLSIHLPGEQDSLQAEGQVVWTNLVETPEVPVGMGVRFTVIDPAVRLRLRQRLESLD